MHTPILYLGLVVLLELFACIHSFSIQSSIYNSNRQSITRLYVSTPEAENDTEETTYFSPNAALISNEFDENEEIDSEAQKQMEESMGINEYSFFDEATVFVRAGSGGQGASTYKKGPGGQNAQPDGGDGGKGGDVIVISDASLNTLAGLTRAWRPNSFGGGGAAKAATNAGMMMRPLSFRAEKGEDGKRGFKSGKFGKDVTIRVPPGTLVQEEIDEVEINPETGERKVISTQVVDIGTTGTEEWDNKLVVALGGEGGEGSGNQGYKKGRGVRRTRAPPVGGERKRLKLTLKIVADVGKFMMI